MNKKPSALAIVVAVLFSVILFPLIIITGMASGGVFSAASLFQPEREEELYQSFVDNGGMDFVYDLVLEGMEEGMGEEADEFGLKPEEYFPKEQVESMVYEIYQAIIKGKEYQVDFSYQKDKVRDFVMKTFDENIEDALREEYGEAYDSMTESKKEELIAEAREYYTEEMEELIEEEFGAVEKELSDEINSIYEMSEYEELEELEEEIGYSLTDRTELCQVLNMAGYMLLGITGFLLVLLLLCHLFRPSGFFTAGAFALVDGGLMLLLAKGAQKALISLVEAEVAAQELTTEEFPEFVMLMLTDIVSWVLAGFEKVGMIGIITAVILILVGVLLLVIKRNKAETESFSTMGMQ